MKLKRWGIAIAYIFFIYATLSIIRIPTNFLRSLGLLQYTLSTIYVLCFGSALYFLWKTHTRDVWRYIVVIAIFLSYFLITKKVQQPEEQIHFFEYGLVGILFVRALNLHAFPHFVRILLALILGGVAGWVDELIQGILPNRYYDPNDIILNVSSVALGLILYLAYPLNISDNN